MQCDRFELDIRRREGILQQVRIKAKDGKTCKVRYGARTSHLKTSAGPTVRLNADLVRFQEEPSRESNCVRVPAYAARERRTR